MNEIRKADVPPAQFTPFRFACASNAIASHPSQKHRLADIQNNGLEHLRHREMRNTDKDLRVSRGLDYTMWPGYERAKKQASKNGFNRRRKCLIRSPSGAGMIAARGQRVKHATTVLRSGQRLYRAALRQVADGAGKFDDQVAAALHPLVFDVRMRIGQKQLAGGVKLMS